MIHSAVRSVVGSHYRIPALLALSILGAGCGGGADTSAVDAPVSGVSNVERAETIEEVTTVDSVALDYGLSDPDKGIRIATTASEAAAMSPDQFEVALLDEDVSVRLEAVEALARAQPGDALGHLQSALDDPADSVRELAVEVLAGIDDPRSIALLLRARGDPSPVVREDAAEALYQMKIRAGKSGKLR